MSYDPNYRPQDGPYNQTSTKGIPPYLQAPDMAGEYLSAMGGPMRGLFGGGGGPQAPGQGGVSGGDFLDAFTKAIAGHLAAQDSLAPAKLQQGNDLLLGRHLGTGGRPEGESQGNAWAQQSWQNPAERAAGMRTFNNPVGDIKANRESEVAYNRQGGNIAKYLPGTGMAEAGAPFDFTETPSVSEITMQNQPKIQAPAKPNPLAALGPESQGFYKKHPSQFEGYKAPKRL